jgi:hypothetical protein
MTVTVAKPIHSIGAGAILWALIGTTEPANTVTGGVFSDAWPVGWNPVGATVDGNILNYQTTVEGVDAAEFLDPIAYETESRAGKLEFQAINIIASNLALALNGGTFTTTGSGATLKTIVRPPASGAERRIMLGWEARDSKERYVVRQAFQGGEIAIPRNKGAANKARIPMTFNFELPDTGLEIYDHVFAGTRAV